MRRDSGVGTISLESYVSIGVLCLEPGRRISASFMYLPPGGFLLGS